MLDNVLNPVLSPVKKVAEKVMTNGVKVSSQIAKKRLQICNSCPHLTKTTRNCKKCLCFVDAKVKYADQKCKLGK